MGMGGPFVVFGIAVVAGCEAILAADGPPSRVSRVVAQMGTLQFGDLEFVAYLDQMPGNPPELPFDRSGSHVMARYPTLRLFSGPLARVAVVALLVGCADAGRTGPCDPAFSEPLAADASLHVLSDAEVSYLSDPPTSGPHVVWNAPQVLERPLSGPEQLGILEQGRVLVQFDPAQVSSGDVGLLVAKLPASAHLAPHRNLDAPVVMTAHLTKQRCRALDVEAIRSFAGRHADPD